MATNFFFICYYYFLYYIYKILTHNFTITYNILKIFTYTYIYIFYNIVCILYLHHLIHIIFSTVEEEGVLLVYSSPPRILAFKQVEEKGYGQD